MILLHLKQRYLLVGALILLLWPVIHWAQKGLHLNIMTPFEVLQKAEQEPNLSH